MGTRSVTVVTFGDKIQIARVGLFDGSPIEAGADILKVLKEENGLTLCDWLYRCTEIDNAEYDKFFNNGVLNKTALTEAYPDFFFGSAADLFRTLINSNHDPVIHNDYNFVYDSLQCEWAYVIDFKEWTFEVYTGFNKIPLTPEDRFYNNGYCKDGYYPVRLIRSYDLNYLPSVEDFQTNFMTVMHRQTHDIHMQQLKVAVYSICRIKPDGDADFFRKAALAESSYNIFTSAGKCVKYTDEVILGQKCDRKELQRLIQDALSGEYDYIYISEAGDLWHSPSKVWETICKLKSLDNPVRIRGLTGNGYLKWRRRSDKLLDESVVQSVFKVIQRDSELQFLSDNLKNISSYTKGDILARNITQRQFADVVMHHTSDLSDEENEAFINSFGETVNNINDVIDCWDRRSPCFDKAVELMAEQIITYFLI